MPAFVALLRAVNVGGIGKLPMRDLKALCERIGLVDVSTYIASGNVVFKSDETEASIKASLKEALLAYAGKPVGVLIRTAGEMAAVVAANPFRDTAPKWTVAIFLDSMPAGDPLAGMTGRVNEEVALGLREIYVHYGAGMGKSRLKIPAAIAGTGRNMNTVAELSRRAAELG